MGVTLATTFVVAVGATTKRYSTVIKETNLLFSDQIIVVSGDAIVIQSIPIGGGMLPQNRTERIIQNMTVVKDIIPILFVTPIGIGGIIEPVPVNFSMGIPVDKWNWILGSTPLREGLGHFPTSDKDNEVIVGPSLADQHNWSVHTELVIKGRVMRIAGILDTKIALLNRCIIMPLGLAQKIYNYPNSVNIISVVADQGYSQQELANSIRQKPELAYVKALTADERNDMIQPVLAQVETWNLGLQTVVFLMSLILVMTVTLMSISERRRDFVTLDAIGAPLSYVLRIVLLETALIGVIGGVLGIAFGSFAALTLASLYTNIPLAQFFPSIFEVIPPLYMLRIFAAVLGVCCLGGVIPALNATKMHIAEVLKAEY
jgi:putative ABC transport system permease protein